MNSAYDWQGIIGAVGVFTLLIVVVVVVVWQFGATWRVKAALAREKEYTALADKAIELQESTERRLAEINGQLKELQSRLQSLELILKDVE